MPTAIKMLGEWKRHNGFPDAKGIGFFAQKMFTQSEMEMLGSHYQHWGEVVAYISAATDVEWWRGMSHCRACGEMNGSTDQVSPDGRWYFPGGFIHYVRDHFLYPGDEFVNDAVAWVTGLTQKGSAAKAK